MGGRGKRTKQMVRVRYLFAALAAIIVSTTAHAADMPLPAPQIVYQQPVCCDTGRWYLRGDVGVGVQTFSAFNHSQTNSAFVWPPSWTIVQQDIQDTAIFGMGIGYAWNSWLRFDVTGEYRTKAGFKATGSYTDFCSGATCFDINTGNISSAVFLGNAYVDLGTWWCLTPFIGAGVGGARNMISGVQDQGIIGSNGTVGFGYTFNDSAQWNLAWDVTAGLSYNVNDNLKIDFSWRYLNMGSPQTAVVHCQNTAACPGAFCKTSPRMISGSVCAGCSRRAGSAASAAASPRSQHSLQRQLNMCRLRPRNMPRRRNTYRLRGRNTNTCNRRSQAAAKTGAAHAGPHSRNEPK
jgi:opacity protein-like surface antigen